jgi:hypothetical protein
MPTPGGRDDFSQLVEMIVTGNPFAESAGPVRALTALRTKLGERFGWDDADTAVGSRVESLRSRLPAELRQTDPPAFASVPFTSLYLLDDEFAAEAANRTMHGILHLGWVPDQTGGYRGQLAVLVKPNGRLGKAYMAVIKPFRHLIVYPALMRRWERAWRRRLGRSSSGLTGPAAASGEPPSAQGA